MLIDNIDRDKQFNTADSLGFLKPSILVKFFL